MNNNLYVWEIKDSEHWPLLVYNITNLSTDEVIRRAKENRIVAMFDEVKVREVDMNELHMRNQSTFVYSLQPQATKIKDLLK